MDKNDRRKDLGISKKFIENIHKYEKIYEFLKGKKLTSYQWTKCIEDDEYMNKVFKELKVNLKSERVHENIG